MSTQKLGTWKMQAQSGIHGSCHQRPADPRPGSLKVPAGAGGRRGPRWPLRSSEDPSSRGSEGGEGPEWPAAAFRRSVSTLPLNRTISSENSRPDHFLPPTDYFWKPKPPSENKPPMAVLPGTPWGLGAPARDGVRGGRAGADGPVRRAADPPVAGPKARGSPSPWPALSSGSEPVF